MKIEAGLLKWQITITKDTTNLTLEILDDILMLNAQNTPREHLLPMGHHVDIGTVIPTNLVKPVGKLLPLSKQLLEATKTAGHRMAAGVNNLSLRQYELNKWDMTEIIRHLVNKVDAVTSVVLGFLNKLLTELSCLCFGKLSQNLRVRRRSGSSFLTV
jgi:hypothetical protein